MQHKDFPITVKRIGGATKGASGVDVYEFEAYASVFDRVDMVGDVVEKGAFAESLKRTSSEGRSLPVLWQHSTDKPIGKWVEWIEDDHGLRMTGELAKGVAAAEEAYVLMKQGAVDGVSIGFEVVSEERVKKDGEYVNVLKEVDLWEASVVTFPAMRDARVLAVKRAAVRKLGNCEKPTLAEFEAILRDVGFSVKAAKFIASKSYKDYLREAGSQGASELAEELRNLTKTIAR